MSANNEENQERQSVWSTDRITKIKVGEGVHETTGIEQNKERKARLVLVREIVSIDLWIKGFCKKQ